MRLHSAKSEDLCYCIQLFVVFSLYELITLFLFTKFPTTDCVLLVIPCLLLQQPVHSPQFMSYADLHHYLKITLFYIYFGRFLTVVQVILFSTFFQTRCVPHNIKMASKVFPPFNQSYYNL